MFVSSRKAMAAFWVPSAPSVGLQKSIKFQRGYRLKRMATAMVSSPSWTDEPALFDDMQCYAV